MRPGDWKVVLPVTGVVCAYRRTEAEARKVARAWPAAVVVGPSDKPRKAKRSRSTPSPVTALHQRREEGQDCGCARAGLMLNVETNEIERCDACALFEDDDSAAEAVDTLLRVLGAVHRRNLHSAESTVADALDHLCAYAGIDQRPTSFMEKTAGRCHCGNHGPINDRGECEACVEAHG